MMAATRASESPVDADSASGGAPAKQPSMIDVSSAESSTGAPSCSGWSAMARPAYQPPGSRSCGTSMKEPPRMPSLSKPGPGAALLLAAALSAAHPARAATRSTLPCPAWSWSERRAAPRRASGSTPQRTGRARTRLPASPVEIWRRHVAGSIDVSPIVDPAGNIVVALTIPEIVELAPDAREVWRARLGRMAPLTPPTLLSDGTIAVVTAEGIAWGFTPGGAVRFATSLGIPRRDADTAPLALPTGGLVVAAGNAIVEIDADGVIVARAALDERGGERAAGAVLEAPPGARAAPS